MKASLWQYVGHPIPLPEGGCVREGALYLLRLAAEERWGLFAVDVHDGSLRKLRTVCYPSANIFLENWKPSRL